MPSIVIGADISPTKEYERLFCEGRITDLIDADLFQIIQEADLRIFNLEFPLTESVDAIKKSGPNLKNSPDAINGLTKLNVNIVTLANNHILDYGIQGLQDTIQLLNKHSIIYSGIKGNQADAAKGLTFNVGEKKIGLLAYAEREFSVARRESRGSNQIDVYRNCLEVTKLKQSVDYVIVLLHAGIEHFPYLPPYLQDIAHCLADAGANLILCQHNHCIGLLEKYQNAEILYGQGNFLLRSGTTDQENEGLLTKLDIDSNGFHPRYIYFRRDKTGKLCLVKSNKPLSVSDFSDTQLYEIYQKFTQKKALSLAYGVFGWKLPVIWMDKLLGRKLIKKVLCSKRGLALQNAIRCEAHAAQLIDGIQMLIDER